VSYAIHGRPPEGDFKPPQAADFAPYHAATTFGFLAGLEQVDEHHERCGTRLHGQDEPHVSGGIASKGKETRPRGSDRYTADYCSAVEKAARDSVADHFRLFMIPGMDHCGLPAQTGRGITEAGLDPSARPEKAVFQRCSKAGSDELQCVRRHFRVAVAETERRIALRAVLVGRI
jgi:hypothetical protein